MPGNHPPLVIPPAPQGRGFFWGGGSPENRTFCVYLGILGEGFCDSRPATQWAAYVDDPDEVEWRFVSGHDVWIWICGFCPRRKVRDVIEAVDPYAEKIVVFDRLEEKTLPVASFL